MSEQDSTQMHVTEMPPGPIYSRATAEFTLTGGAQIHSWITDTGMPAVDISRYGAGRTNLAFTFEQWDALFAAVNALRAEQVSS